MTIIKINTKPKTAGHPGPASHTPEWYAARRLGVTATEIAKLAKGYASDRRKILREKLTGDRVDLSGQQAIEYGKLREPLIAAWIEYRFGIPANELLYISEDGHALATPDGYEVDPMDGEVYVSEVKTSKHDLTPGTLNDDNVLVLTKGPGGRWYLYDNQFAKTGYYDQMQWQMFVTGATRTLFAWEQHDGDWSGWPTRAPKTITDEPGWCWVLRDDKRIAELVEIADVFIADVRTGLDAIEAGHDEVIPELSEEEAEFLLERKRAQEIKHERARELARKVVVAREQEAVATAQKTTAWKELQELLADETDWLEEGDDVRISITTSMPTRKVVDTEAMKAKAPLLVDRYEKLVGRHTHLVAGEPKSTLTVTVPKGK